MRTVSSWSVPRFLKVVTDIAWYVMVIGAVAAVVLTVSIMAFSDGSSMQLNFPVSFEPAVSSYQITDGSGAQTAQITNAAGQFSLTNPSLLMKVALFGMMAAAIGLGLTIVYQLRKIFATLAAGDPFVRDNAARIWFIGIVIIVGELLRAVATYALSLYVMANFSASGLALRAELDVRLITLFVGVIVLALAEVFRRGAALREDQEFTV